MDCIPKWRQVKHGKVLWKSNHNVPHCYPSHRRCNRLPQWTKSLLSRAAFFCVFSGIIGTSVFAVTLDDLANGISDRESALQSFAVTVKNHIQRRGAVPGKYETLDATDTCIFDVDRIRCEDVSGVPGNTSVLFRGLGVFNGKEMRLLQGETSKQTPEKVLWASGRIAKQPDVLVWQMDPRRLFLNRSGRPFSLVLREGKSKIKIAGESTWEGRSVIKLESGPFVSDTQSTKAVYFVDPSLGFAVVWQASYIQFPPDSKWIEYAKTETSDYFEIESGIWVPRRALHEFSQVTKECVTKDVAPELFWRGKIQFNDWRLNPETSEDMFTLRFPGGIPIEDNIVGTSYITTNVQDQILAGDVAAAQTLSSKSRSWVFFISLALFILVVVLVVYRVTKYRALQ